VPRWLAATVPQRGPSGPLARARHHHGAYLDNLSRDSNDLYLAEGITEEIISRLGQVRRLVVKSRYAVRRFRALGDQDAAALGRALGVRHLVTGSIERSGPRLRVRVELVAVASGRHVWGGRFDRADGDVLAIEDDIAQAVAREVAGRLAPAERAALTAHPTPNRDAYDHYLKGNFYLSRRTSEADGRRALEEYQAALALDPAFAAAHGRLGLVYGIYANWPWTYAGLTFDSLVARGLAAADRAIALDSGEADGWLARGFRLIPAPTDEASRGFVLDPNFLIGPLQCPPGSADCIAESQRALARAARLDSMNAEIWYQHARAQVVGALYSAGSFRAADWALQRSLALETDRAVSAWLFGWSYVRERRWEDAVAMLDSARALGQRDSPLFGLRVLTLRMKASLARGDARRVRADLDTIGGPGARRAGTEGDPPLRPLLGHDPGGRVCPDTSRRTAEPHPRRSRHQHAALRARSGQPDRDSARLPGRHSPERAAR
jgi:TolB-like protein